MDSNITRAEATLFAVAICDKIQRVNPVMPSMVILEVASRIDFKSDNIVGEVHRLVADLTVDDPFMIKPPLGDQCKMCRIQTGTEPCDNCRFNGGGDG